jgi:hypothetical protein
MTSLPNPDDALEAAIRKSIGMRERDQHDAMVDFGAKKITAEQLKALSDESRELFVRMLLNICANYAESEKQALLDTIQAGVKEAPLLDKYDLHKDCDHEKSTEWARGYTDAEFDKTDQLNATIEDVRKEL